MGARRVFSGMFFMLVIDLIIPHVYILESYGEGGNSGRPVLVAVGIAIHNFPEGMATFCRSALGRERGNRLGPLPWQSITYRGG